MKNTAKILLVLAEKDREMNREELIIESGLSPGVLSGTLFFMKKQKLIKVISKSIAKPPWKRVTYNLNPEKSEIIIKLLKDAGIRLV